MTNIETLVKQEGYQSFEEMVEQNTGIYVNMVKRFGKQLLPQESQDILDERYFNIFSALKNFSPEKCSIPTFIGNPARYTCMRRIFSRTHNKNAQIHINIDSLLENSPSQESFLGEIEEREKSEQLWQCVEKLPPHLKNIVKARYGSGYNTLKPWDEVSKETGLSQTTCSKRLKKAFSQLKEILESEKIHLQSPD